MQQPTEELFTRRFAALLFDMDGTLLDSIAAAERVWGRWAEAHGLDAASFVPTIHGKRGHETIAALGLPGVDPNAESDLITAAELVDIDGIVAIAGASAFLQSLPPDRWAVVTSAPLALARIRLAAAGLPTPPILITAGDVAVGKPDPECFLLAARRLGVNATDCLVLEDADSGIRAAEAAGASVLVITATHRHTYVTTHPTVADYSRLTPQQFADGAIAIMRLDEV